MNTTHLKMKFPKEGYLIIASDADGFIKHLNKGMPDLVFEKVPVEAVIVKIKQP